MAKTDQEKVTEVVTAPSDAAVKESTRETQEAITDIESELGTLEDVDLDLEELESLEEENADLRDRVTRGREGVKRLLARIRFMEEQG